MTRPSDVSSGGTLEALVERILAESDPAALARGRAEFEARTGSFGPEDPWFEERARAAFEHAIVEHGEPRGALLHTFAARHPEEREAVTAVGNALRSLFFVQAASDGEIRVVDLFGLAPMRLAARGVGARLRPGDRFDGRIASHAGVLELLPGAVFHPSEAEAAIDELLVAARASGRRVRPMLDGLLRMRMRWSRFTGMHARHVYRWDAIDQTEILVASWARPKA